MTLTTTFTVEGMPVSQPRARVTTVGGFARAYVPAKHPVHAFRATVASEAVKAGCKRSSGPVDVIIDCTFARPKSHYTQTGRVRRGVPSSPRPDLDNIAKAVLDALTSVCFDDDSQVQRLVVSKSYGACSSTLVRITQHHVEE